LNSPVFQENIMTFAVPYGLALQTLQLTKLRTTLLPKEIAVARKIRRKKPWAVATAATLLCGLATSVAGYANAAAKVNKERFGEVESSAGTFKSALGSGQSTYESARGTHNGLVEKGTHLVSYLDHRELWAELYRGINEALPRAVGLQLDEDNLTKIPRVNVRSITAQRYSDLKTWFDGLREQDKNFLTEDEKTNGPAGEGYVMTLMCEHYFAPEDRLGGGVIFVRDTLVQNLRKPSMRQGDNFQGDVPVAILGISHPVITDNPPPVKVELYENGAPKTGDGPQRPGVSGQPGTGSSTAEPQFRLIDRTTFTLQFAWKPTKVKDRVLPETTESTPDGNTPSSGALPGTPDAVVTPGGVPAVVNPTVPGSVPPESAPALGQ
jgi:type IV pilus assembly protein PilM